MLRQAKRILVIVLVVGMLFSLLSATGCAKKAEPEKQVEATKEVAQTTGEVKKEEPPVTLTLWSMAFEKSFPAGVQSDLVAEEITKKTGVILDITPMNAVSNYNDKLAAALASNDLPDIAFINDMSIAPKIISAKAALAMDDYLEKFGQDILKDTPYRVEFARKFDSRDMDGKPDGKMYFWKTVGDSDVDPLQVQVAPYLRYDLWEKMGSPKLETMDDYIPVLAEMMKMEPTNKDGKKNYGVSAWFGDAPGWNDWVFHSVWGMFEGYGVFGTHLSIDMVTHDVDSRVLNPDSFYWKGIEWFNKAYRAGIVDPDCFTMKWDNFLEKVASNRVFLGWAPWCMDGGNKAFIQQGSPDKGYVQMPPPVKGDRYMVSFSSPQGGNSLFISSKTKYPEKAVTLLNFFTSIEGTELILNGVKGVHWDEENGKPKVKEETLKGLAEDPDYRIKTGVNKYHNLAGRGRSTIDPKYNTPVYFAYLPEIVEKRMDPLQKKMAEHFKIRLPGDLYMNNPQIKYTDYDTSLVGVLGAAPDDVKEIDTKINNLVQSNAIKLILAKSEADFAAGKEKLIEECRKLGIEKSLQWAKDDFARVHGK